MEKHFSYYASYEINLQKKKNYKISWPYPFNETCTLSHQKKWSCLSNWILVPGTRNRRYRNRIIFALFMSAYSYMSLETVKNKTLCSQSTMLRKIGSENVAKIKGWNENLAKKSGCERAKNFARVHFATFRFKAKQNCPPLKTSWVHQFQHWWWDRPWVEEGADVGGLIHHTRHNVVVRDGGHLQPEQTNNYRFNEHCDEADYFNSDPEGKILNTRI